MDSKTDDDVTGTHVDSPSGSVLLHNGSYTNWVNARELQRVMKALHNSACSRKQDWLNGTNVKYVGLRIDMRTGDFLILDAEGKRIDGIDSQLAAFGLVPLQPAEPQSTIPHQGT